MARGCHVRVFVYMRCSEMLELMIWQQTRLAYDSIECSSAQGLRRELCASNQSFDRIMHACAANLCFIFIEDFMFCVQRKFIAHDMRASVLPRAFWSPFVAPQSEPNSSFPHTHACIIIYANYAYRTMLCIGAFIILQYIWR